MVMDGSGNVIDEQHRLHWRLLEWVGYARRSIYTGISNWDGGDGVSTGGVRRGGAGRGEMAPCPWVGTKSESTSAHFRCSRRLRTNVCSYLPQISVQDIYGDGVKYLLCVGEHDQHGF